MYNINHELLQRELVRLKMAAEEEKEHVGPYRADQLAATKALDHMIAATTRNRKEHLGHYLLNPFVRGPISEGLMRLGRRATASEGSIPNLGYATRALDMLASPLPVGSAISSAIGGRKRRDEARQQYSDSDMPKYQEGLTPDKGDNSIKNLHDVMSAV